MEDINNARNPFWTSKDMKVNEELAAYFEAAKKHEREDLQKEVDKDMFDRDSPVYSYHLDPTQVSLGATKPWNFGGKAQKGYFQHKYYSIPFTLSDEELYSKRRDEMVAYQYVAYNKKTGKIHKQGMMVAADDQDVRLTVAQKLPKVDFVNKPNEIRVRSF